LNACCKVCRALNTAIQRYSESNIPTKYWKLEMDYDFRGDKVLLQHYQQIVGDLRETYKKGTCLCFAGGHGLGKTMTCTNILKRAVEKGYTAHYATLNDIVASLVTNYTEDKAIARRELLMVDFLVIDEFDPRYMGSDQAADLFGRILEDIFRTRSQNCMPIFMCTNSPNVVESFNGPLKRSIASLMNYVQQVSVLGKDFRKEGK
jgi:DNA replication protein DnaC